MSVKIETLDRILGVVIYCVPLGTPITNPLNGMTERVNEGSAVLCGGGIYVAPGMFQSFLSRLDMQAEVGHVN